MGMFTEGVTVQCSPVGTPQQLLWHGQWWTVAPDPLCWYERQPWWEREVRMPPGEGIGKVDIRIWRLQITPEGPPARGSQGAPPGLTLDVVQQRPSNQWRVIKIHDAVDDVYKDQDSA